MDLFLQQKLLELQNKQVIGEPVSSELVVIVHTLVGEITQLESEIRRLSAFAAFVQSNDVLWKDEERTWLKKSMDSNGTLTWSRATVPGKFLQFLKRKLIASLMQFGM